MQQIDSTMRRIMEYLSDELAPGEEKFISYTEIGNAIERSRHAVKYSIAKLQKLGKVRIKDRKLSLA